MSDQVVDRPKTQGRKGRVMRLLLLSFVMVFALMLDAQGATGDGIKLAFVIKIVIPAVIFVFFAIYHWALGDKNKGQGKVEKAVREFVSSGRVDFGSGGARGASASLFWGLCSLSLFPAPITAPLAFLFGILAIRDIKKHPDKTGIVRTRIGIGSGAVGIVGFLWLLSCF